MEKSRLVLRVDSQNPNLKGGEDKRPMLIYWNSQFLTFLNRIQMKKKQLLPNNL